MKLEGYLVLTLRPGIAPGHVPAHLDCLSGAGRAAGYLDGGPVDRAVRRYGGGARYRLVFHARRSLGRPGEHHRGFDDCEERHGLSRTYHLRLADAEGADSVVNALLDLDCVENCAAQTLAMAPLAETRSAPRRVGREEILEPYRRIRAVEALREEPGDAGIRVGVCDTGIVVGHPEFQRRCLAGYDTVDLGLGRVNAAMTLVGDSRGRDYNPFDEVGHGCLVAGIIGAQGWRIPAGLAGRALLLPVRVLAAARAKASRKTVGVGGLADIDCGLKVAVDLGADVINMSFGSPAEAANTEAPPPHSAVARYAIERGCVLVAAMGNSGKEEQFFPAALPEVIAVGSVDRQGRRSRFSTFGQHIALSAPGEQIIGVGRHGYQANSGTSFAAPFVAGVAALMLGRARRRGVRLDPPTVRQLLIASALALPSGPGSETGAGLVDALGALRAVDHWLEQNEAGNGR